jgi:hypothetical protein
MKANKYIFEVGDMNKQKLTEVEREKKGERRNSDHFQTREKKESRQRNIWGRK